MKLSEIKRGSVGIVTHVESTELAVLLMKHGLMVGDRVELTDRAPFGGPLAVLVNGQKVALRRREAGMISVNPLA